MKLPIYQVDAFANKAFEGNPAAICPLKEWLNDDVMQSIAAENNLSETAFYVMTANGFHIHWFTPTTEADLDRADETTAALDRVKGAADILQRILVFRMQQPVFLQLGNVVRFFLGLFDLIFWGSSGGAICEASTRGCTTRGV